MSAVRSTARSSPPSADERLATGGPSRRRGAGGEDRANAPFSGTSNARGSREAVSIRMARGWVRASNQSPTRDRARHAPPVVPTRRFGVRHADKDTNALLMTDTAGYRRAPPARRASVRRDRGDASARHGDATASCEAMRVRARALVPASPRAQKEASGILGACVFPRERVLWRKKSREATHESSWQVPKNFERILRAFRGRDSWRRTSEAHLLKTSARFARIVFLEVLRVLYFLNSRAEPLSRFSP